MTTGGSKDIGVIGELYLNFIIGPCMAKVKKVADHKAPIKTAPLAPISREEELFEVNKNEWAIFSPSL